MKTPGADPGYHRRAHAGPRSLRRELFLRLGRDEYLDEVRDYVVLYLRKRGSGPDLGLLPEVNGNGDLRRELLVYLLRAEPLGPGRALDF